MVLLEKMIFFFFFVEQDGEAVGRTESRDEWARWDNKSPHFLSSSLIIVLITFDHNDNNDQITGARSEQQWWKMGWLAWHWS